MPSRVEKNVSLKGTTRFDISSGEGIEGENISPSLEIDEDALVEDPHAS